MDHSVTIGIHQPNFIPWFGYFYKIIHSNCFVFLDNVIYSKKSFTRRVKIHHPSNQEQSIYCRINLQKHSDQSLISELKIHEKHDWIKECLTQWENAYRNTPHYANVIPSLTNILEETRDTSRLSTINTSLIIGLMQLLHIKRPVVLASQLDLEHSDLHINLKICKSLEASHYLSGQGAKKYQTSEAFEENKIKLEYIQVSKVFEHFDIPLHLHNKSIISWMMHYSIKEIQTFLHYK